MFNASFFTTIKLLILGALLASLAGCAPKSKQFKLKAPTKARRIAVTTVHVTPDGECADLSDKAFTATSELVAKGVATALETRFGEAGISASYRETPDDLPFLYQRRIFSSDGAEDWITFFPSGQCPGLLSANPKIPAAAAPPPEITFPDTWKIDFDATLFIFAHSATLNGPPPTDLIEDVPEDYLYASVVGYALVDNAGNGFLGSGHRTDSSDAIMEVLSTQDVRVDLAEVEVDGLLFDGEDVMNQVLVQTLYAQIAAIAEEIGTQLTDE